MFVNGERCETEHSGRSLLSYVRFDLGLTGTKYGCGEGLCGACTVLVDGEPLKSCMSTVGAVQDASITTIEGLAREGSLHPLQRAFIEESAMQCGYCIPGFIMAAAGLLERDSNPSEQDIERALADNICRCGMFGRIKSAIMHAAEQLSRGEA